MKRSYKTLGQCTILTMALCITGFSFFAPSWQSINDDIARKFPEIKSLSTEKLAQILDDGELHLIDVRQPQEFAVSSIKGAVNIQSPEDVTFSHDSLIIAYCSVGYRSAKFASQLQQAGHTRVYNLHGSIFEWANKGYPLYRETSLTHFVHPFDDQWGKLLNKKYHSYTPIEPIEEVKK